MGTILIAGIVVLVLLGFGNHVWWLAAVGVLFLYLQYGRDKSGSGSGSGSRSSSTGGSSSGSMPATYQAYRKRRDMQAKWERRYRRERPLESRRQEKSK